HGIAYEVEQIATTAGLSVEYRNKLELNIEKSAGPSTCVLASCSERNFEELKSNCPTPVFIIGKLIKE
ncbi:MAG: selenophosphate synthase, partial [Candidatus Marinimicrobia bacterium]|nr:selenophosphate synthase [Candidatus Neomarinimicrobiota bacterium]